MRGVGWRAGFGVRGVQVLLDGVPLTMADGQAVLNGVDPAFVRRVEALRGPASVFWGNASGGVLALSTRPDRPGTTAQARQTVGAYGLAKTDLQASLAGGGHALSAYASYLDYDGYRAHSHHRAFRAGFSGRAGLGGDRRVEAVGVYAHVPEAQAPGALTEALVEADPRQADPLSAAAGAGKLVDQGHLGLTYADRLGGATVRATTYGALRALDNALPFGYVVLDRRAGGVRLTAEGDLGPLAWGLGAEADAQRDDRTEFDNASGRPGATVQTDQVETAANRAAFGRAAVALGRLRLSGALRYDRIRYAADDRLGSGDGARTYHALSPSAGAAYPLHAGPVRDGRVFANVSTALDTPTTQELGNRPDGQGGFNLDLRPERTAGVEAGAFGRVPTLGLTFDAALFALRVRDLITPFELAPGGPTFYRNEGTTRHLGAEVALATALPHGLALTAAYTYLDAAFSGGTSSGNEVPGVPAHRLTAALDGRWGPVWVTVKAEAASGYYVDSANTTRNGGYAAAHVRASHPGLRLGGTTLVPFVAVRNVTDARYSASVVVNAAGGRYFEPAAGRHWQAGLTLALD
jgi:iron complex outermembrane receptor protein